MTLISADEIREYKSAFTGAICGKENPCSSWFIRGCKRSFGQSLNVASGGQKI
jgi:hypothetical protein